MILAQLTLSTLLTPEVVPTIAFQCAGSLTPAGQACGPSLTLACCGVGVVSPTVVGEGVGVFPGPGVVVFCVGVGVSAPPALPGPQLAKSSTRSRRRLAPTKNR